MNKNLKDGTQGHETNRILSSLDISISSWNHFYLFWKVLPIPNI